MTEEKLIIKDLELIDHWKEEAITLLKLEETCEKEEIVKQINSYVDGLLAKGYADSSDSEERSLLAYKLGALWGDAVKERYQWQWSYMKDDQGNGDYYLVSGDKKFCCPVFIYFFRILSGDNVTQFSGKNDNTVLLLYHMLEALPIKDEGLYNIIF